jgi:phosphoglycerate dehydrogenase-like enzyme
MKILFCDTSFQKAREILARLLPHDQVLYCSRSEIAAWIGEVEVAVPLMSSLNAKIISQGRRLRLIQQFGVGLEGVDLAAARAAGIPVANVPSHLSGNSVAVSEWVIFLMLALARDLRGLSRSLQERRLGVPAGRTLFGKRAGIVGLGNLGCDIARRLKALGMEVWGIRRHPERREEVEEALTWRGGPEDLATLLPAVDFLVLAVPLGPETRGLIGREQLRAMKPTAFLINVSRGPVVDYQALLWALQEGEIAGAGLDVFWQEPIDPQDPIFAYNVIASPHIAGVTDYSFQLMAQAVAENVERLRQGRHLLNRVA